MSQMLKFELIVSEIVSCLRKQSSSEHGTKFHVEDKRQNVCAFTVTKVTLCTHYLPLKDKSLSCILPIINVRKRLTFLVADRQGISLLKDLEH